MPKQSNEWDGFHSVEGYALVDLCLFSSSLEKTAVCHKCRKGSLRLKIHEKRMGFESKLF
jgi:hypothetical protein